MTVKDKALEEISKKKAQKESAAASNGKKKVAIPSTFKGLKTQDLKGIFELYKDQIAQALPKHLTPERVIQLATTLVARNPEIAECTPPSIIGAVMQASILGFEPVNALGQCYFVPFRNKKTGKREIQFIVGYKGLIELARRSDQIKTIYAQAVYENDEFEFEYGLDPKLYHKPALENRGEFTHAYAVAKFTNGGYAFEVMSKSDIDKIRASSQAGSSSFSPWNNWYDEMAKKTVLRRLSKILPMRVDIAKQVESDEKIINTDSFERGGELNLNAVESVDYEIEATETAPTSDEKVVSENKAKDELF